MFDSVRFVLRVCRSDDLINFVNFCFGVFVLLVFACRNGVDGILRLKSDADANDENEETENDDVEDSSLAWRYGLGVTARPISPKLTTLLESDGVLAFEAMIKANRSLELDLMADSEDCSSDSDRSSSSEKERRKTIRIRKLKSCGNDRDEEPPKKKRKLPSLKSVSKLFNDDKDEKKRKEYNDPSKHQGRIRRFDHEKGSWSVHIYIPINEELSASFDSLFDVFEKGNDAVHKMEEYHLSLSICQNIRTRQISDFVDCATKMLRNKEAFNITMNGFTCFENETKNRYFGCILVEGGKEEIIDLIDLVNQLMLKWGLNKYYDDPQPHISLIWSLKPLKGFDLDEKLNEKKSKFDMKSSMTVDTIIIKIGHRVYTIKLF